MRAQVITTNTILYCKQWEATVRFFRDHMRLPVHFSTDWFVAFELTPVSRVSIADEKRATIKSAQGQGLTLGLEVKDIRAVWDEVSQAGLKPTPIKAHPWDAEVFYLYDPEGHRIEIWQAVDQRP